MWRKALNPSYLFANSYSFSYASRSEQSFASLLHHYLAADALNFLARLGIESPLLHAMYTRSVRAALPDLGAVESL
jgi:hypothetical protein